MEYKIDPVKSIPPKSLDFTEIHSFARFVTGTRLSSLAQR